MVIEQGFNQAKPYDPRTYVHLGKMLLPKHLKRQSSPYQLSKQFAINMALLGLEERSKQASFAQLIEADYHQRQASFIEAQTGIGKPMAICCLF